jgi:LacI family transcriptional regulator
MVESRVTIADVALQAGVSTQTVSRVINNKAEISSETRQRVLDVIQRLGYRPNRVARSLVTQQTFTIGLVIPDIANPFFSELTRGAEDVAWENGYNVLLCNTVEKEEREKASLHLLEETRVDGVILCSSRIDQNELFPLLESFRAVVMVNRPAPARVAGVVRIDDFEGGFSAANYLLRVGRQELAFLAGPVKSFSGCERLRGGVEAMKAQGLLADPARTRFCPPKRQAGYDEAIDLLKRDPAINGLVCYNDLVAVGALQACTELGRDVPGDVAIVGFDDIVLSRVVCPPLSTLSISKVQMGAAAARMLLDRMQGREEQDEIVMKPNLVLRGSTPGL